MASASSRAKSTAVVQTTVARLLRGHVRRRGPSTPPPDRGPDATCPCRWGRKTPAGCSQATQSPIVDSSRRSGGSANTERTATSTSRFSGPARKWRAGGRAALVGGFKRSPRQRDVHNAVHHVGSILFLEAGIVAFWASLRGGPVQNVRCVQYKTRGCSRLPPYQNLTGRWLATYSRPG